VTGPIPITRRLDLDGPQAVDDVPVVLEAIADFLDAAGCAAGARMQIELVLEEVLVNVVRNAWPDPMRRGIFRVSVRTRREDALLEVEIVAEDDGIEFDPTAIAAADTDAPLEDRAIGGLGIHFMREFTDAQDYARIDGCNRLTLRKRCPVDEDDAAA
jgi:anti-sigma regulatory factor (Ser/Thr protein kinase)